MRDPDAEALAENCRRIAQESIIMPARAKRTLVMASEAILRLDARVDSLEERVRQLERRFGYVHR